MVWYDGYLPMLQQIVYMQNIQASKYIYSDYLSLLYRYIDSQELQEHPVCEW